MYDNAIRNVALPLSHLIAWTVCCNSDSKELKLVACYIVYRAMSILTPSSRLKLWSPIKHVILYVAQHHVVWLFLYQFVITARNSLHNCTGEIAVYLEIANSQIMNIKCTTVYLILFMAFCGVSRWPCYIVSKQSA